MSCAGWSPRKADGEGLGTKQANGLSPSPRPKAQGLGPSMAEGMGGPAPDTLLSLSLSLDSIQTLGPRMMPTCLGKHGPTFVLSLIHPP